MKNTILLILIIFCLENIQAQSLTKETIVISQISPKLFGARFGTVGQISFQQNSNGVISYRKNINKKFKKKKELSKFLTDSCDFIRLKEISLSIINDSVENICKYHYEKGYFKIEIIKENFSAMYSESFIIDLPYKCIAKKDEEYINKVLDKIYQSF